MTTLLSPELKNGSIGQPVLPIGSELTVPATSAVPALLMEAVTKRFAGITALNEASLRVDDGEIVGLIGPNGAGKTTLFDCISRPGG